MKEQKILAERLIVLCREKRLSYYLLSYKAGVPVSTIMNIIHCCTRNPGLFTIFKLCQGLGISAWEFFDTKEYRSLERETD